MTGNPVRQAILRPGVSPSEAKEKLGFNPDRPLVLITGGSLGAGTLNNVMLKAIADGKAAAVDFRFSGSAVRRT